MLKTSENYNDTKDQIPTVSIAHKFRIMGNPEARNISSSGSHASCTFHKSSTFHSGRILLKFTILARTAIPYDFMPFKFYPEVNHYNEIRHYSQQASARSRQHVRLALITC